MALNLKSCASWHTTSVAWYRSTANCAKKRHTGRGADSGSEETVTKICGGSPNSSSMKTVTPVYCLHSPVKLLRPSLCPPTAAPTQTSHLISLPGCLIFHCLLSLPRGGVCHRRATSGHQEVQGFFSPQPYRPDALPHFQELPCPHASIAPSNR